MDKWDDYEFRRPEGNEPPEVSDSEVVQDRATKPINNNENAAPSAPQDSPHDNGFILVDSPEEPEEQGSPEATASVDADGASSADTNGTAQVDDNDSSPAGTNGAASAEQAAQDATPVDVNDVAKKGIGSTDGTTFYSSEKGFYGTGSTMNRDTYSSYSAGSGYASSNDGGDYNGGNGGGNYNHGGTYSYGTPSGKKKAKKASQPLQISKRGFILALILAMVITAAASVGGMVLYDNYFSAGSDQATNYTLSDSTESLSYKSIINKTSASVVSITTESIATDSWAQNYVTQGAGSGVIIQKNGYILTCNHVIEDANKITVTLKNEKTYTATVVGTDSSNDIAVLKIKAKDLTTATYGDSSKLEVGDEVVAIGNPLGELSNTATTGIISALNRNLTIDGKTLNLLQTDASINPGNSGGALFNASGNLIGIVVAKSSGSDVEGLGFAIPINKAAEIAKDLIKNGKSSSGDSSTKNTGNAAIGVTVQEITESDVQQNSGYDAAGVYIVSVSSENAQAAGLQSGDRIAAVDGTSVSSTSDLSAILKKHSPGDKVKLTIYRNGQQGNTQVTLTTASN